MTGGEINGHKFNAKTGFVHDLNLAKPSFLHKFYITFLKF